MRRILPPVLTLAIAALLPAAAQADCPGATGGSCPYTAATQNGQRGGGVLRFPQAVAVGPDGLVYVTDQGSHVVQQFTPEGPWLRDIGTPGSRPGELSAIGAVAVTGDNQIVVADGGSNRIVRFDNTGSLLGSWGGSGTELGRFHFGAGGGNDAAAGGGLAAAGSILYIV